MLHRDFKRMFTTYFILFGIVITLLGSVAGYKIHTIDIQDTFDKYANEVYLNQVNNILRPTMQKADDILHSLSSDKILYSFIKDGKNKDEVKNIFLAITKSQNVVFQARYIDEFGKEIIRIDRPNEQSLPFVVNDSNLQDKSGRDYFQIVSKLKEGDVWYSKFDLNIENGKIEVPYKPTIRIATPIYIDGSFKGIVIVNLLTQSLIKAMSNSNNFKHYIIDKDGYYILHPDSKYNFNRYTKIDRDLSVDFPTCVREILNIETKDNHYVYSLKNICPNGDELILILKPKDDIIKDYRDTNLKSSIMIAIISIIISLPLAFYASKIPQKIQKDLLIANKDLESFSKIIDKYVISATTSPDGIIKKVSSAFCDSSGYARGELLDGKTNLIRHPDTPNELYKHLWNNIANGMEWHGSIKNRKKDGTEYWLDQTIIPIKDDKDKIVSFMSIGIDITAKKELEKISYIDNLTKVYNRRKLDECFHNEIKNAKNNNKKFSIIIIDIDHFKKVNDTYGHQVGDDVLKEVARILDNNIAKIDCLGRWGGEEFLILAIDSDKDDTINLAEHLRKSIEKHTFDTVDRITISVGVATYSNSDDDEKSMLNRADKGLYIAKENGRNRVEFV